MDQFGAPNDLSSINFVEVLKNKYYERPTFKSFMQFKKPDNYELDTIINNTKRNGDKFLIYYLGIAAIFYTLFLLIKPFFLLPLGFIAGAAYLVNVPTEIQGIEITPLMAVLGCVVINFLISLVFSNYAYQYIYFFALSCFVIGIVMIHSQFVVEEESDEVGEKL